MFERSSSRDVSLGKKIAAEILVRMSITESSGFHDLLSLSRVNDPPFFFSRLGRPGGVCASQPRYRPLSRKPRLCPGERSGLVSTPSLHESPSCTRVTQLCLYVCVCTYSVGTTHEGENAMLKIRLERRSSSRIDESSFQC